MSFLYCPAVAMNLVTISKNNNFGGIMKIPASILIISCALLSMGCASKTEREFLGGCQSTGMDRSVCKCVYKKLEDKYGEERFKSNLYTLSQTESFQNDMVQSSLQCIQE